MDVMDRSMLSIFADTEPAHGLLPLVRENWLILLPAVLGFVAIYFLLPKARGAATLWGGGLAAMALSLGAAVLVRASTDFIEALLFYAFAGMAMAAGVMMITHKNPVHAALSFALVVLSTCGLFLLQAAPFLMAATIIVYAGAIVVTFLFVIMLARQEGPSNADQRSREPFLASLAGCILLASLVCILHKNYRVADEVQAARAEILRDLTQLRLVKDEADVFKVLSDPKKAPFGKLTPPLVEKIQQQFPDGRIELESENLKKAWVKGNVAAIRDLAMVLHDAINGHGVLSLGSVPGKEKTPGHGRPGRLPAGNVAALGKTLFTDYLIAVELAAVLLLVATIGAIVIAGRRTEVLR